MDRAHETQLAKRALAGDMDARDQLVLGIWPFIYQHAIRLARRHDQVAADLAQIGTAIVVKQFNRFDPDRGVRFISYFGIAAIRAMEREAAIDGVIRLGLQFHRTPKKLAAAERVRGDKVKSFTEFDHGADMLPGRDADPADIVSDRDATAHLRRAIQTLPRQQMRCMRLKLEGRKNVEIAGIMGICRERVRQLEYAATARLRKVLA